MPPCKGHKKSRNGCLMCKRRRVKCDETRPECRNCTGHSVPLKCAYAQVATKWETKDSPVSSGSSSDPTPENSVAIPQQSLPCDICGHFHRPVLLPPQAEFPGTLPGCTLLKLAPSDPHSQIHPSSLVHTKLSNIDLFLLNRYITTTSRTLSLSSQPDATSLWSRVIPTLIIANPFLFHSALAIASAHLSHSQQDFNSERTNNIRTMEKWHYGEAMKYLKNIILNGIDEVNCHATFAGSVICILYLIYQSSKPYPRDGLISTSHDTPQLDTSWVLFIRGAYGALLGTWSCISHGPVSALIQEYSKVTRSTTRQLSKNTESMLIQLTQLCINFSILGTQAAQEMTDVPTATAYYSAIYNLRIIWTFLEGNWRSKTSFAGNGKTKQCEPFCSAIIQSALRIPGTFWDCLEAKRPRALIIYAYLVVCWEGLGYSMESPSEETDRGGWWVSGKAENDLKVIGSILDSLAVDDGEREVWKKWIGGAWRVFYGLRNGWWILPHAASDALEVVGYVRRQPSGIYDETMPPKGSGIRECTDAHTDWSIHNTPQTSYK